MAKKNQSTTVLADGYEITIRSQPDMPDFISLTDIAKRKEKDDPNAVVQNWMRNNSTIEFLGEWEKRHNPNFNMMEYMKFQLISGKNSFIMSPKKWIEGTNAIGIESKAGRYGGTFAHHIIAFEFLSWVSPAYKLFFMEEYERLKVIEVDKTIKEVTDKTPKKLYLLPDRNLEPIFTAAPVLMAWLPEYEDLSDDDIVNMALFGITQEQFQRQYPTAKGTVHNNSAVSHIITHNVLQKHNGEMIAAGITQKERFEILNRMAMGQTISLVKKASLMMVGDGDEEDEQLLIENSSAV